MFEHKERVRFPRTGFSYKWTITVIVNKFQIQKKRVLEKMLFRFCVIDFMFYMTQRASTQIAANPLFVDPSKTLITYNNNFYNICVEKMALTIIHHPYMLIILVLKKDV